MGEIPLKNCPFCGGRARAYVDSYAFYTVQCNKCNNGTLHYRSEEEAAEKWNRRADDKPAIPVEWLRKIQTNMPQTVEKMGADMLLMMWEKEQEGYHD